MQVATQDMDLGLLQGLTQYACRQFVDREDLRYGCLHNNSYQTKAFGLGHVYQVEVLLNSITERSDK